MYTYVKKNEKNDKMNCFARGQSEK